MKTGIRKIDKEINLTLTGEKVRLPIDIQKNIDEYWSLLLESGKPLIRGEVFSVVGIEEDDKMINIKFSQTDYAHYLYSRNIGLPLEYACINVHTSCLIETVDNKMIIGRMGSHTAAEDNVQCVGGGLDKNDINGDEIDYLNSMKREVIEEININPNDKGIVSDFNLKYLFFFNEKINFIALIFVAKLKITAIEFEKRYSKFEKELILKGEYPEFKELIYLSKNKESVDSFCKQHKQSLDYYIQPLLEEVISEI